MTEDASIPTEPLSPQAIQARNGGSEQERAREKRSSSFSLSPTNHASAYLREEVSKLSGQVEGGNEKNLENGLSCLGLIPAGLSRVSSSSLSSLVLLTSSGKPLTQKLTRSKIDQPSTPRPQNLIYAEKKLCDAPTQLSLAVIMPYPQERASLRYERRPYPTSHSSEYFSMMMKWLCQQRRVRGKVGSGISISFLFLFPPSSTPLHSHERRYVSLRIFPLQPAP